MQGQVDYRTPSTFNRSSPVEDISFVKYIVKTTLNCFLIC